MGSGGSKKSKKSKEPKESKAQPKKSSQPIKITWTELQQYMSVPMKNEMQQSRIMGAIKVTETMKDTGVHSCKCTPVFALEEWTSLRERIIIAILQGKHRDNDEFLK